MEREINIQIIGHNKCNNTKKTVRFFKERRISFHFKDITEKPLSRGELENISRKIKPEELIDTESKLSEVKHFVNLFKTKYNKDPDILAGYGYDVVNIAVEALKHASIITPDNIKSALYNIKDFPGVTGKTSFDLNGDVIKDLRMMQVKNGKFIELEK